MRDLLIYALEAAACSGILLAAYSILLERRVRFLACRLYLPAAMALAAVIPALSIPVWNAVPAGTAAAAITAGEITAAAITPGSSIDARAAGLVLYGCGVAVMSAILLMQLLRIAHIRRSGTTTCVDGVRTVRIDSRISAFSFFGTIYVGANADGEALRQIVMHESSHIRHRHSCERIVMELLRIAAWWNPFVWIAARRLVEVEEYEADNDVLQSGTDTALYAKTIFEQAFGYSPEIANGFRNSLTKKRFQMMTSKKTGSTALRVAATLPIAAVLLASFGFTARATEYDAGEPAATVARTDAGAAQSPAADKEEPALHVDKMPAFGDGGSLVEFRQWIMMRIRYPKEAYERKIKGLVVVSFVVGSDGNVKDIAILKSPDQSLSDEAVRVMKMSPAWTPGEQDGKPASVKFVLPITFAFADDNIPAGSQQMPDAPNTVDEITVTAY
ncbi:MAG: M56 family metallopeptidase [Alistipes sp.]|nr:M56 family metallopeptidase [Alistipes sp.]